MQNAKAASLARFFPRPHKALLTLLCAMLLAGASAQTANAGPDPGYGMKIFRVESALYPFVQIYLRTFDQNMDPLINLNERNVGIMVAGRAYDPFKRQYFIQSVRNRPDTIRSVLVIDTSATMSGVPFNRTIEAIQRFINIKRDQDQVAIIALRDNTDGYELVSNFESNPTILYSRLGDLKPTGKKTRLYDGIAYALQTSGAAGAGASSSEAAQYPASTCIIVFSDGKDEGSAIDRSDLMNRITSLEIPVPIYSIAYTRINQSYLKNLQALSKNSFGIFYNVHESQNEMTKTIERIQNILQNDYVLTFRSYIPFDGRKYGVKVGIEYPANSGKMRYESAEFEAIEPLTRFSKIREILRTLDENIPESKDGPYYNDSPNPPPFPQN